MSKFSGEFDLFDHMMMEKTYEQGNCRVSDELECFEEFKKRTGGVIYQNRKIKVTDYNLDYVIKHCTNFTYAENPVQIINKKPKKKYIYTYYGQEFNSLKEVNKHGVYGSFEVHFNTLLDLVPYYPYVIASLCASDNKEIVYISSQPGYMEDFEDDLDKGYTGEYPQYWIDELQKHYLDVCRKYYLKDIEKRTKQISLIGYKPLHNGYYEIILPECADYMHEVQYVWSDGKKYLHWCSPCISTYEPNVIWVSEKDIEHFLADDIKNNRVSIQYVAKCDFEKDLE